MLMNYESRLLDAGGTSYHVSYTMSGTSGIRCDPYRVGIVFVLRSGGGAALAPGY